jgi:hypothetical protein
LCVIKQMSLRRTDHSSRGVPQSVVCLTECDLETSKRRWPRPDLGCCATGMGSMEDSIILNCPFVLINTVQRVFQAKTPIKVFETCLSAFSTTDTEFEPREL